MEALQQLSKNVEQFLNFVQEEAVNPQTKENMISFFRKINVNPFVIQANGDLYYYSDNRLVDISSLSGAYRSETIHRFDGCKITIVVDGVTGSGDSYQMKSGASGNRGTKRKYSGDGGISSNNNNNNNNNNNG
jgi:hypothetical protein